MLFSLPYSKHDWRAGFHSAKPFSLSLKKRGTEDSRGSNLLIRSYDGSPLTAVVSRFVERAPGPEEEVAVEECKRDLTGTGAINEEIHRRCGGGGGGGAGCGADGGSGGLEGRMGPPRAPR